MASPRSEEIERALYAGLHGVSIGPPRVQGSYLEGVADLRGATPFTGDAQREAAVAAALDRALPPPQAQQQPHLVVCGGGLDALRAASAAAEKVRARGGPAASARALLLAADRKRALAD